MSGRGQVGRQPPGRGRGGRGRRGGRGGKGGGGGGVYEGGRGDVLNMRETLYGITKPVIRRLARRAGVKSLGKSVYMWIRDVIEKFLQRLIKDAFVYTRIGTRKTCTARDVILGLKRQNRTILGHV